MEWGSNALVASLSENGREEMNYALVKGIAAATALAAAGAAQAAVVVEYDQGQTIDLDATGDGLTYSGSFAADVIGSGGDPAFTASFSFTVPEDGEVSIAGISIRTSARSNIDFSSGYLDGTIPFLVTNGVIDQLALSMTGVSAGFHTIQLNGNLNAPSGEGVGSIGGSLSFALVPEPATWALFIMGFGTVGAALRRRTGAVRVTKAKLTFA